MSAACFSSQFQRIPYWFPSVVPYFFCSSNSWRSSAVPRHWTADVLAFPPTFGIVQVSVSYANLCISFVFLWSTGVSVQNWSRFFRRFENTILKQGPQGNYDVSNNTVSLCKRVTHIIIVYTHLGRIGIKKKNKNTILFDVGCFFRTYAYRAYTHFLPSIIVYGVRVCVYCNIYYIATSDR